MYEKLLIEYEEEVEVIEAPLSDNLKGLYADGVVVVNDKLSTTEKACVIAEELGHHYTTAGDILDQSEVINRKLEKTARNWGYEKLVGLADLVNAYKSGVRNRHELAEFLGVTEEFIESALNYYREKHGLFATVDGYVVYFEPLGVFEKFF
ncbi:hypothetical protein EUAN_12720 [Andreesenia angusta]|uniref:IrrE N-terminal-like domain-containing protein n=1 Tax=Andreesenia angusta TaxID=39480 RepID=A0A1S1V6F2_9FIRM|nr:ImmA/IrrE family metallo-endopeptidase [Andreesenia angusta]OHW62203.1 hypothetical protein EUAN_12720 [Andreesenia angusta]